MATFISLAISDTMFPDYCSMEKVTITADAVRDSLNNGDTIMSALNPSHASTIDAIKRRFDLDLPIPDRAPKVLLDDGDVLIVVQAQLPRLQEGQVHSQETIDNAKFKFSLWRVRR